MAKTISVSDHFTFKKLARFVWPSILMMIVTSIYGVVDGFFVSNYVGKTAFAAVNLIWPVVMIVGGIGFVFGTGGVALVLKTIGEKQEEKANRYFSMIIIVAFVLGLFFSIIGFIIMPYLAQAFGATGELLEDATTYGRITIACVSFYILQNVFQSFLAGAEKPKLGLYVTLIAGISNGVLDWLFMVIFKWGIAGAAIATGIGQFLGGVIPLIYFARPNTSLLRLGKMHFEWKPLLTVMYNGSSEFFTNVSASIVSVLYNMQLMSFIGEDGVSAYGVLMYVQLVFVGFEIGYSIGVAPIISYHYGAKNDKELKNLFKKSIIVMITLGILLAGLAELLAAPLASIFVGYDKTLYDLTVHAFRIFSLCFIFSGISIFSSGFFTALNDGLVSALLALIRSLAFQISCVFILPAIMGVEGIWWAMFAAEVGAFIVATCFFIGFRKKYKYI